MILAGDIGGTKTLVALYERNATHQLVPFREAIYPSRSHASLEAVVDEPSTVMRWGAASS